MAAMSTTGVPDDRASRVDDLYEEHRRADFPDRLRDDEPAGVDLVPLDADLIGVVTTWLHGGGRLDASQQAVVSTGLQHLDRVLPELADPRERRYVERLRELAGLVAEAGG